MTILADGTSGLKEIWLKETSGKPVNYQTYNRHQVSRCGLNHLVNWAIEVNRAILFEDGLKSILFLAVYKLNEGRPINSKSL